MIYVEPDSGPTPVVHFVEAAEGQLLINDYYLNDADVLDAISEDVHRGVKVSVIIKGNPYGLSRNVNREEIALIKVGAIVHIAPPAFEGQTGHATAQAMSELRHLINAVQHDRQLSEEQYSTLCVTAPDDITRWIVTLNEWRLKNDELTNMPPAFYAPPAGKVGRNESCTCGSGKKYKKCCAIN